MNNTLSHLRPISPLSTPEGDVCLYIPISSLTDDLPTITCPITASIAIYEPIYSVSDALKRFISDAP